MKNIDEILKKTMFYSGTGNPQLYAKVMRALSEYTGRTIPFQHISYGIHSDQESNDKFPNYPLIEGKDIIYCQCMETLDLLLESIGHIWALKKQYLANSVKGVFTIVKYRRADGKRPDEVNRLEMVIDLLTHCGLDELMVVTPHSEKMAEYCHKYGAKFREIDPSPLFRDFVKVYVPQEKSHLIRIYSPDAGSVPRAIKLAKLLGCPVLFNLKNRGPNHSVTMVAAEEAEIKAKTKEFQEKYNFSDISYAYADSIKGMIIFIVEDEVSTGETANTAGQLIRKCEPLYLSILFSHGVLTPGWREKLFYKEPFDKVGMTDSIFRDNKKRTGGKIHDVFIDSVIAETIYHSLIS